jgi:hypothetical protein
MPYYIGTIWVEEPVTGRQSRHVVRAWVPGGSDAWQHVAIDRVRRRISPDKDAPPMRFAVGPVSLSKDQERLAGQSNYD